MLTPADQPVRPLEPSSRSARDQGTQEASEPEAGQPALEQQVRSYLAENFFLGDGLTLTPSQSLLRTGVLDSTGVMELITWLESTFQIMIQDSEVVPANLDSIGSIAAFVARKVARRGS